MIIENWLKVCSRIGLVAAALIAPFTGNALAQSKPTEVPALKLPNPTNIKGINAPNFLLYIIAKDAGFLERYNITLTETHATVGGVAIMPIIVSGEADVVENGASSAIIARSRGAKVTSVAAGYTAGGDFDTTRYYVRKGSGIKSAKDLDGKRVAVVSVGATPDIALSVWLGKNGVKNGQVQRIAIPYANMTDALLNDQVDAIGLIDVFYRPLEAGDAGSKVELLFRDREGLPTDKLFLSYTFSDDYIAKNPAVIKAFIAALKETLTWVRANPQEARKIISEHYKLPLEKLSEPMWPDNLCIDPKAGAEWASALEEVGQVQKGSLKSPNEWMTNEFNPDCPK